LFWKRSGGRQIDSTTAAVEKSFLESCDFLAQGEVFRFLRTKLGTEVIE
jgi:hypothetical protein